MFSCDGNAENEEGTEIDNTVINDETKNEDQSTSGTFSWDNIPVYTGAVLESIEDCPAKWS